MRERDGENVYVCVCVIERVWERERRRESVWDRESADQMRCSAAWFARPRGQDISVSCAISSHEDELTWLAAWSSPELTWLTA